jgi:hypothetical protein
MKIKKLVPVALALAALGSALPAIAANRDGDRGEAKLAKILDGRVAGEAVRCLDASQRRNMQVVDRTALVFRDGDTLYVNRPSGANFLTWSDVPVFKIWGSQLCAKDFVRLHDSATWMSGPTMVLGEFVPYRAAG